MITDIERSTSKYRRMMFGVIVLFWALAVLVMLLWVKLASANCQCYYLNGRATQVCSSSYDSPVSCGPGEQDLRDQLEHNRREWRKLMAIRPGDEDFDERMGDYVYGDEED